MQLLALTPGHRAHREELADRLWPELGPEAAANNLRRALHVARRVLDQDPAAASLYLRQQGDLLALCPDGRLWVDVDALEAAAADARRTGDPAAYEATLGLYAGDLLPEDRFEEWVSGRRETLRHLHLSLLVELARLRETRGELVAAIEALGPVVAADPTHEEAQASLVRLYALTGRRAQALRQYRQLQEALRRELDAEPQPSTQRVYRDVLQGHYRTDGVPARESRAGTQMASRRHNLPAPTTSFVGRERETSEVRRLLGEARLLTLIGAGGSGKTRLALEAAAGLAEEYADGVCLVELAPVTDPTLVPRAVADTLGVPEAPGQPPDQTLVRALEDGHLLLVLDNCEHLLQACAELADLLLRACRNLRILATSRQALGIAGEWVWRVPSLSLPDPRRVATVGELTRCEAGRLFVERASVAHPGFGLTPHNAQAVARICQQLDGMPLALELAASRVRALSAEQIASLLADRFRLLIGGSRAALPRQRTLRATVDWSYSLLSDRERAVFDRLSVFAGGWTLEAAEAICGGQPTGVGLAPLAISAQHLTLTLDLLADLVDKSLVIAERDEAEMVRYRMLETLRQYGEERLAERGELEDAKRRHAEYYLALAEAAEPDMTGSRQVEWLDRLEVEHDNLRSALGWLIDRGELQAFARLVGALGWFWYEHSHFGEACAWAERVMPGREALSLGVRAKAVRWLGLIGLHRGSYARSQEYLGESLALARMLGDRRAAGELLNPLGGIARDQGDFDRATVLYEEALAAAMEVGDTRSVALSIDHLGDMAMYRGDHVGAARLYEESLGLFRQVGDQRRIAVSLMNLASAATETGDTARGLALCHEGLDLARLVGDKHRIAEGFEGLAGIAAARGQLVRAGRLLSAAAALREAIGLPVPPADRASHASRLSALRAGLREQAFAVAWAEGRAMELAQALAYARDADQPDDCGRADGSVSVTAPLTRREREIAALVARGLSNREIAAALVIAEGTAANHVQRILGKLGFRSRAQIASWATERGLQGDSSQHTCRFPQTS